MPQYLETAYYVALLALGFGFVVFWHELGHFLAAKWAGVLVEQFAVGFAQAVVSWRKGIGFRIGNTQKEFRARVLTHMGLDPALKPDSEKFPEDKAFYKAAAELGLGETEYRLNWLPLGGYVKMLGQDDLRPNSEADDPRAYNRQTIGKRMVIVSAGVLMNVLLAAVGFVILFSVGFHVPPARVGNFQTNAPFQLAGGRSGDHVLSIDGQLVYNDFTKMGLTSALAPSNSEIPVEVKHAGSSEATTLRVTPQKSEQSGTRFVSLGVGGYQDLLGFQLRGKTLEEITKDFDAERKYMDENYGKVRPGDVITHVNGKEVATDQFYKLDEEVQKGLDVQLTIKRVGVAEPVTIAFTPRFAEVFGADSLAIAGMYPRQVFSGISSRSPLRDKVEPGDVLHALAIDGSQDVTSTPSFPAMKDFLNSAGAKGQKIRVTVLRNGVEKQFDPFEPVKISPERYGLSVAPSVDLSAAVVADVVPEGIAAKAGIPARATILKVGNAEVKNWGGVHRAFRDRLAGASEGTKVPVTYKTHGGEEKTTEITFGQSDINYVRNTRYVSGLLLKDAITTRIASGFGEALKFGLIETRDFILQFYVTLKRMATNDVSPKNLMGPLGIFQTGSTIAQRGYDWLLWFLCMISANLAVVNFLPIPVVDGGLFTFLLIEKVRGRPASPKVQAFASYVGLVLLLGIFVFVTYQDAINFTFRMAK